MSRNPMESGAVETLDSTNQAIPPTERLLASDSHLNLPPPSSEQLGIFTQLLRSDTAETAERRLVSPETAYNVLLDQLNTAQAVRERFNNPDSSGAYVTDRQLLTAYYHGADAYAGMIALAPDLAKDSSVAGFQEWSTLAASLAHRIEATQQPRYSVAVTPAALAHNSAEQASVRHSIAEIEQFERIYAYEQAAQSDNSEKITEAYTGTDASRLERAQALFEYAHTGIPSDETQVKIQCLTEVVDVLKEAVMSSERPRDDDLVGIYNYFMLQSMLGRAIHDIIWIDARAEETEGDARARRISIDYLTNATDALSFVKYQAITAYEAPEESLHLDLLAFDATVKNDPILSDARQTIDFLTSGLSELHDAEKEYQQARDNPQRNPDKEPELVMQQKKVEYLSAKAAAEKLETKIDEQQQIIRERFQILHDQHQHITDRLMALRSEHIGLITSSSRGRELAKVVLTIDKQLNDARFFTTTYSAEYEPIKNKRFTALMQRANVLKLLQTLEAILPERDNLRAPALPQQEDDVPAEKDEILPVGA